jgi:hypothetical protein
LTRTATTRPARPTRVAATPVLGPLDRIVALGKKFAVPGKTERGYRTHQREIDEIEMA